MLAGERASRPWVRYKRVTVVIKALGYIGSLIGEPGNWIISLEN